MKALKSIEIRAEAGPLRLSADDCWTIVRSFAAVCAHADRPGEKPTVYADFVCRMSEVMQDAERRHSARQGIHYEGTECR